MTKKKYKTHDHFVRWAMSDLELARAFFRRILGKNLQDAIDLDALSAAKETYVGADLDEMITDLLYVAPFRENDSYFSLLVEHKSEGMARREPQILPFQMRFQEMKIMAQGKRNHPKKLYPLVHMVALYHGSKAYSGPLCVAEKIDAPDAWLPDHWQTPMILIDLSAYSDAELMQEGKLGLFLLILKHIYDPDMLLTLKRLIPLMAQVEELARGAEFLTTLFRYPESKISKNWTKLRYNHYHRRLEGAL